MTLLMVWRNKAEDATSINIASDSLLSNKVVSWPYAAKIHRLQPTSDFIAYTGDSFVALSAITSALGAIGNADHLSQSGTTSAPTVSARVKAVHELVRDTFALIPDEWNRDAQLVFVGHDLRKNEFSAWKIEISPSGVEAPVKLDFESTRVHCFGSGKSTAESVFKNLAAPSDLTSKVVIQVLVSTIDRPEIKSVGGAPQMVTLTRKGAISTGFIWGEDNARHLFGMPVKMRSRLRKVRWVSREFEEVK